MPKKNRPHKSPSAPRASAPPAAVAVETVKERAAAPHSSPQNLSPIKWRGAYALIPVALAFLASLNTLWNGFASDDQQQVLKNAFIKELGNLPLAFTTSVWSFVNVDISMTAQPYYRPLFSVLFTLNYALFGHGAWGWHLVNVLIHAAATFFVYLAFKEFTGRRELAAVSAGLFAVHPAHAESVAWISGVTDPLLALFFVPGFYVYLRYRKTGQKRFAALVGLLYFLGLLAKETAVALPLVIAYCEFFHFTEASLKRRITGFAPLAGWFALATALYFLMRYQALGAVLMNDELRYPLGPALASIPLVMAKYLALMAIPYGYSYQHLTPFVMTITGVRFLAPLALVAALAVAIFLSKSKTLRFASFWFLATLAPALAGLRHFDPEYLVQERYLYLPSMGFCLAVALAVERLASHRLFRLSGRAVAMAVVALLVVVWGAVYAKQNRVWDDTVSLYRNCIAAAPRSASARGALSSTLFSEGKAREAEAESQIALELDPKNPIAYQNLSYFAYHAGKLDQAIDYLEQGVAAVRDTPTARSNLATLHLNLGNLYARRKDLDRAEQHMLKSLEVWSRAVGYYHVGQFYFDQGRYGEALTMFERAGQLLPQRFAPLRLKLALTYDKLGQKERARGEYEKYLECAPRGDEDRNNVMRRLSQL